MPLFPDFEVLDRPPMSRVVFSRQSDHWSTPAALRADLDRREWIAKGIRELDEGNASIVVYLVPSRTDTAWFHDLVLPRVAEIRFCRGRLRFNGANTAPFPSMLLVFRGKQ